MINELLEKRRRLMNPALCKKNYLYSLIKNASLGVMSGGNNQVKAINDIQRQITISSNGLNAVFYTNNKIDLSKYTRLGLNIESDYYTSPSVDAKYACQFMLSTTKDELGVIIDDDGMEAQLYFDSSMTSMDMNIANIDQAYLVWYVNIFDSSISMMNLYINHLWLYKQGG